MEISDIRRMRGKIFLCILTLILITSSSGYGQSQDIDSVLPILLDKSVLSGIGLKKIDLKDEPEKDFFQKMLFRGEQLSAFVVSSQSWTSNFDKFWFDEFIYLLNGKARIKPFDAKERSFYTGDYFFAPKGFKGEWEIQAGENYHYELSLITTKRADSTAHSTIHEPILLDRSELSGLHTVLDEEGKYAATLARGVELTINYHAQSPRKDKIQQSLMDEMIHIISGQITLSTSETSNTTYYTGDFVIVPKGFSGTWHSEGHGLVKYISIIETI